MPGAYAHITIVNILRHPLTLERAGLPEAAIVALLENFKFCELGAVSPDYPYLNVTDKNAARWADLMHYQNTGNLLRAAIRLVRNLRGAEQAKAFSWLLGYAAHVTTDVTIHPVVEMKVGSYAENKGPHRICEMHQDAYIFQRMNLGPVGLSEHLDSGIRLCCDQTDNSRVDPAVAYVWDAMLKECYPIVYQKHKPNIDNWHCAFQKVVDTVEESGHLMPFARHVAVNCGLTYPAVTEIDRGQYIDKLETPLGFMSYDQIFDKAVNNVRDVWICVSAAIFLKSDAYLTRFGSWDLDTGKDKDTGIRVFWEGPSC